VLVKRRADVADSHAVALMRSQAAGVRALGQTA
jgi:hypothetical protein